MRWLKLTIAAYIIGLALCYTYAVFNTLSPDWFYFSWAKVCDVGIFGWGTLYATLKYDQREVVKWLFLFSILRFLCDVQTWFTGVGVNNEVIVAALFLILVLVLCYLTIKEFKKIKRNA